MINMAACLRETWRALKHWPDGEQWFAAAKVALPALAIVTAIGFLGGWLFWYPHERQEEYIKAALIGFILYAIPAELFFRGFFLTFSNQISPRWGAWISTVAFVLSFPFYASINQTKWNDAFLMPSFWFAMLILGIILSHIRIRSRSLWPCIIIHGFAAMIWMAFLGGRSY